MPTYSTLADVRNLLLRTLQWKTDVAKGNVTEEVVNPQIVRAENTLRARLDRYYRFPLNSFGTDSTTSQPIYPYPIREIVTYLAAKYTLEDHFCERAEKGTQLSDKFDKDAETLIVGILSNEIQLQGNRRFSENPFTNGEIEPVSWVKKQLNYSPPTKS